MVMRCKPGDLATIEKTGTPLDGELVKVKEILRDDIWRVILRRTGNRLIIEGSYLNPIRPKRHEQQTMEILA